MHAKSAPERQDKQLSTPGVAAVISQPRQIQILCDMSCTECEEPS